MIKWYEVKCIYHFWSKSFKIVFFKTWFCVFKQKYKFKVVLTLVYYSYSINIASCISINKCVCKLIFLVFFLINSFYNENFFITCKKIEHAYIFKTF